MICVCGLTDRAQAAGDSPVGARMWDDGPCPPGHNTPLPLERSPPASFKRLLGGVFTTQCEETRYFIVQRAKAHHTVVRGLEPVADQVVTNGLIVDGVGVGMAHRRR